jgi:hypothetical protein
VALLKDSNFTVSKPSIDSPKTRKISEVSAKPVLAKEDIGIRLNSMFLILEERCMKVVNNAGIVEIKYMESGNEMFMDVKNIAETSHKPK